MFGRKESAGTNTIITRDMAPSIISTSNPSARFVTGVESMNAASSFKSEIKEGAMAEKTAIEWCDATFNPWIGCTKVSPGCDGCYAEQLMAIRYRKVKWGPHGERVRTSAEYWKQPLRWAKKARKELDDWVEGRTPPGVYTERPQRPRVFCASLADVFDNQVPPEWRADLFDLILKTPELDWLLLTKRPENIAKMLPPSWFMFGPLPNVWLGFTAEDQPRFDHRWPIMREIPAAVRFCSYEPAIGPLRLPEGIEGLHWLICGGESGPGYRPMPVEWPRNITLDCELAGIAMFMKQMAGKKPIPEDLLVRQFPVDA